MSLDHLREQLRADAEAVTPPDAVRRVHAVRALNRRRRRRKVTAVVVATTAIVATLVAVPMLSDLAGGPDPVDKPSGPFPEKVDGDTRIASTMGEQGDTSVTMTFTPDDTDFLLDIDCEDIAPAGASTRALKNAPTLRVTVNETTVMPACGKRHDIGSGIGLVGDVATPDQVRSYWEAGGVRAGGQVTVTVRATQGLTDQARTAPIDGRVGVAAYDMTGERVTAGGAALPKEKTVDGRTYDLDGYDVASAAQRTAAVDVPAVDEPALVTYGTRSWLGGVRKVTVDGEQGMFRGKGGVFSEPLPDTRPHTVRIKDTGAVGDPTDVVVAYYTRAEEGSDAATLSFSETTEARDPLVTSDVGAPGEAVFRTTFKPDDTNLALSYGCASSKAARGRHPDRVVHRRSKGRVRRGLHGRRRCAVAG